MTTALTLPGPMLIRGSSSARSSLPARGETESSDVELEESLVASGAVSTARASSPNLPALLSLLGRRERSVHGIDGNLMRTCFEATSSAI
jgi:hypothetical protein